MHPHPEEGKGVSHQKPYTSVRTDIKDAIDHIGAVYLGIHLDGSIFSVQVFDHTLISLKYRMLSVS